MKHWYEEWFKNDVFVQDLSRTVLIEPPIWIPPTQEELELDRKKQRLYTKQRELNHIIVWLITLCVGSVTLLLFSLISYLVQSEAIGIMGGIVTCAVGITVYDKLENKVFIPNKKLRELSKQTISLSNGRQ